MKAKNIILIGMPTSGKSTAGVILAKILGMDFVDTDLLLQRQAKKKLKDIIAEDGLDAFLKQEEAVCCALEADHTVIATGGSVVYGAEAMAHLKTLGTVVYLHIDPETLKTRLHNAKQRGVVLRDAQTLDDLYEERKALYEKYADIVVTEGGRSLEETVAELADRVQ